MNILMVLSTKTYPPDERVEREARDLIRDGHKVFLMARRGLEQSTEEIVNGVRVIRTPLPFQRKKTISDLIYFTMQRYWIFFHILLVCRKHRIKALHVHDLPYAFATVLAGKTLGIPVIFDMHEHYTEMQKTGVKTRGYKKLKPFFAILIAQLRIEEQLSCRWAYRVIVVAEEHIARIQELGVPPERIVVVTNTEDTDFFGSLTLEKDLLEQYRNDFVLLYFGGFSGHRGLETAIQAMPRVLEKIPNAKLLLVGHGYNQSQLERLTGNLNLTDTVVFTGFQPFRLMPTYITLSKVGLIPHISTPHVETTMPNKIFQFMLLGKPVIVSSVRPLKRVVDDAQCGLVFEERNPRSLAQAVLQLQDAALRHRLGENGRKAVKERYNWQQTVRALLGIYRHLSVSSGKHKPSGPPS
jgi:glycosyltransferase involved in cell wall biosynthesis